MLNPSTGTTGRVAACRHDGLRVVASLHCNLPAQQPIQLEVGSMVQSYSLERSESFLS